MRVTLEVIGPLRRKPEPNPCEIELPAGSRVLELMVQAGYSPEDARHLTYLKGEARLKLFSVLVDGDSLQAILHVGGG